MASHARRTKKHKRISVPAMIALDLLCIAAGLLVFAYFHHVRDFYSPVQASPVALLTPSPAPVAAVTTSDPQTPEETPLPEEQSADRGMFYLRFADQFTDGDIIRTENSYKSAHVSVTVTRTEKPGLVYHVAEIYISDIRCLRTAFSEKGYGYRDMAADIAAANGAVVAISGDYYSARKEGIIVRNGILYRETPFEDICVLFPDGRLLTLSREEVDLEALKQAAPVQVWSFGPKLLADGKALTEFRSTVERSNPRSAIGCVEPGHYFFVQVDGRNAYGSRGMTLGELAQLFEELGCQTAYNLDGGQTAGMVWNGELITYPYGRSVSDIILITDEPAEGEG